MGMKLNIGSSTPKGQYIHKPWVNIDANRGYTDCGINNFIVGDGCLLPFRDSVFEEIRAIHVLEHLPRPSHLPLLKEISRVLKPDGVAFIEVPNFLGVCSAIVQAATQLSQTTDTNKAELLKEFIRRMIVGTYGKGRHEFDFHHWGFTPWNLLELGEEAGLKGERSFEMISAHHRQEPVLLIKYEKIVSR